MYVIMGYGGGDLYILIRMAHSRWARVAWSCDTIEVRATMVAHMAVTRVVRQSGRSFQWGKTCWCVCVHGKCYLPAIDQIVIWSEKYWNARVFSHSRYLGLSTYLLEHSGADRLVRSITGPVGLVGPYVARGPMGSYGMLSPCDSDQLVADGPLGPYVPEPLEHSVLGLSMHR